MMAAPTTGGKSLKDYLKKYESTKVEEKKKKKKKAKPEAKGVLVVDEDPVWAKPVNLEEEENGDDSVEEKPLVDEDIEVKRMKRLEQIRARRAYNAIAEDGSGWVSLSPKHENTNNTDPDISPPCIQRARNDSPSARIEDMDLSPPRLRRRHHTPSPKSDGKSVESIGLDSDLSPPRKRYVRRPSLEPEDKPPRERNDDLSPPRRKWYDSRMPASEAEPQRKESDDLSPPRRTRHHSSSPELEDKPRRRHNDDLSPPRQKRYHSPSPELEDRLPRKCNDDLSPPRRKRYHSPSPKPVGKPSDSVDLNVDLSLPRKKRDRHASSDSDFSPPSKYKDDALRSRESAPKTLVSNLSPPRRLRRESPSPDTLREQRKTGLISGRDIRNEILKTKKDEFSRFEEMDPMLSGRGAEPVFRDKIKGERISKEEYLKSKKKVEEKPKEIKLEWGKGLAQKREAETRLQELELEKSKPFARTRDDPGLDKMLKERLRWGDPMAHLVKNKQNEPALTDLGNNEKMKESGFIIPQDIPNHSWIKRGLDAAPNRYGIKPGRHWDGVDRSNGYEKKMFQRMNEKRATEREAYLWSVSDM